MPPRLAVLFGVASLLLADGPAAAQLEKAPAPKRVRPKPPPPPPAEADPAKAAADPDFAAQGEYVGPFAASRRLENLGVQVVALGGGTFVVKVFPGGLPGAGWDGRAVAPLTATRHDGRVAFGSDARDDNAAPPSGVIDGKRLAIRFGGAVSVLQKVERASPTLGAKPPAGATVLFAGPGDESAHWVNGKLLDLSDGTFLLAGPTTKQPVGAFKAHVEFRTPWMPTARGQQRGNSGVYVQQRYEVQVLDSFGLEGKNNECGALYTQTPPKVNMCLPPLVWQTYDIDFTPAAFDAAGQKTAPARITVVHNGVTVHDNAELPKQTGYGKKEDATPGPVTLQDHRSPVAYRNVWLVETK
jgi:hypothetical protein